MAFDGKRYWSNKKDTRHINRTRGEEQKGDTSLNRELSCVRGGVLRHAFYCRSVMGHSSLGMMTITLAWTGTHQVAQRGRRKQ